MIDLKDLRAKAEAVPEKKWAVSGRDGQHFKNVEGFTNYDFREFKIGDRVYSEFIAAANPQVIIELLDRIEKAETALRDLLQRVDINGGLGEYKGGPAFAVKNAREYFKEVAK